MIQIYKITFKIDDDGKMSKSYMGIIKPEDYENVEAGISMVIQHIYQQKMIPQNVFGLKNDEGNLLDIIFSKNAMGDCNVSTHADIVSMADCENIITGLGEILMRLHLERMKVDDIKITLKRDADNDTVDYTPDNQLV